VKSEAMAAAQDETTGGRLARILAWKPPTWATALIAVVLIAGAWWLIYQEFHEHDLGDIWAAVLSLPKTAILWAAFYSAMAFVVLVVDEYLSLYLMNVPKPFLHMLAPAYATYSISNALSFSFATGPAVRTRLYRHMLKPIEIGTVSAVTGASVFVGASSTTGFGLLFGADEIGAHSIIPALALQAIGALMMIPALLWLLRSFGKRHSLTAFGITITTPGTLRAVAQLVMAIAGWLFAAAVLWELLPAHANWPFLPFAAAFVVACYMGAASGAPAGIGVFDAAILSVSLQSEHAPETAAALIVYRIVYTLAPLLLGAIVLGVDLLKPRKNT
jgi:phosphatidylglycerol lysyltransferase